MSRAFTDLLKAELGRRSERWQYRRREVIEAIEGAHLVVGGQRLINFASNDYLGLTQHPRVRAAIAHAAQSGAAGTGASGLITGFSSEHAAAERAIAEWKGTESAVLLPSGYQAAHAAIQTVGGIARFHSPGVRFLIDKLAHASLIDAVGATRLPYRVFPHNGMEKLARLLREAPKDQIQVVVTESIFSMDGDSANLSALAGLKKKHDFVLVLDEAHACGIYGPGGAGLAAELGAGDIVDVGIVTCSKAIGVGGGAVCGSSVLTEATVNWGRAYIYSTSVMPALAVGAKEAIAVMRDEPERQQRVRKLAIWLRGALAGKGATIPPGNSPIVPIVLGEERSALEAAKRLRSRGMLVVPIRPPTVARGTSRLRITLSSEHRDQEVEELINTVSQEVIR